MDLIKTCTLILTFALLSLHAFGQNSKLFLYEPSAEHPFGLPNPDAPQQIKDWAPLVGECDCTSIARKQDQTWSEPIATLWRFKYIMNGMAVQDESLKADGAYSGSIRQFVADSTKWYVHYYASNSNVSTLPTWEGTKVENGKIILYRPNKAPNGMDGFYKITFYDMDKSGFKWLGEWVDPAETVHFPMWKFTCHKRSQE